MGAFGATDLQHGHRLVEHSGAVERGGEALGFADSLDKAADNSGVRIFDQIFEELRRVQHRLVAGRHDVAEAEAAHIGQQADAQPAALGQDADIAGELLRVADLLQISRVALDGVQDTHAVRAAQRDPGFMADVGNLLL